MPAFEAHTQKNGVYMTELLKHIHKDKRIEIVLMDVNEAVNTNPFVVQRPMFETDTIDDCRLTCKIDEAANFAHWSVRFDKWFEATSKGNFKVEEYFFIYLFIYLFFNLALLKRSYPSRVFLNCHSYIFFILF